MDNREKSIPEQLVDLMLEKDAFSHWLGIERISDQEGANTIRMKVRADMLNGFGIIHGGVSFSLADSALAFAANSYGIQCLSVENAIHYHQKAVEGDVLTATSREVHCSKKIAVYAVEIKNQNNELIATFKGTVYRTNREWNVQKK